MAAFINFWKAFDCVQHSGLLNKLSSIGLDAKVLDWFKSDLGNRSQRVLANNKYSSYQYITQGVPQGSVLGPLFYIIYANDIVQNIKYCKIALYADDKVLYLANNYFANTVKCLQSDMDALSLWCQWNGIHMNTDKTSLMLFGNLKRITPNIRNQCRGTPLKVDSNYRYLGIPWMAS